MVKETSQVPHDSLEALEAAFEEQGGGARVAAVIAEPVIGAGGLYPPLPGYLEGVQALCRKYGALFIADSVISGFGRLGTWFGVERFGLEPDMIVFAKGVTSGYLPLGGVMVNARVSRPVLRGGRADLQARRDLRGAPDGLRGGAGEPGHPGARAPARPRA